MCTTIASVGYVVGSKEVSSTEYYFVTHRVVDCCINWKSGTDFFTADYVANASYGGAHADSITIDSAGQVTATWTFGLPPLG
jgi:hypothetical protein